jgi:multisite-specific tRNA:(cytosine-C5)-methyltransferase
MGRNSGKKRARPYNEDKGKGAGPYEPYEYKSNDKFEAYYKAQNIVPEADFPAFIAKLLEPLPTTWRVNPLMPSASAISVQLESMAAAPWVLEDGSSIQPPQRLSWYPGGLAWHVSSPKSEFRKHTTFKVFHQWLIAQTDAGCITRQEAVSMVPPLLLDVQPEHMVLDMCASPGSKTSQMLEALHAGAAADRYCLAAAPGRVPREGHLSSVRALA